MVVLAQLVEHRIVVPSVVGSSPTFHPKNSGNTFRYRRCFFCADVGARSHLFGDPANFNLWGERSARRKCFTRAVPVVT